MTNEDIIGTWKSKDFPLYTFEDSKIITLHVSNLKRATLWVQDEENSTLVQGKISVINKDNDSFELSFDGDAIEEKFFNISSRMYIKSTPPSFLLDLPDYGERYMEKTN